MIRVREDIEGFSPGWGCTRTQSWPRTGGWRWTWGTSSPRELLWNITFPDMSPLCFSSSKLKRPSRLSELRTALKSRRTWTIISFGSLSDVIWLPQWLKHNHGQGVKACSAHLKTLGLAEVGSWGGGRCRTRSNVLTPAPDTKWLLLLGSPQWTRMAARSVLY